jgi:hypothetical protein
MKHFAGTILFLCLSVSALAQRADTVSLLFAGLQAHYGFIIPHSEVIEPVSHSNPVGFGFSLNRLNTSYERWKIFNAYWISGIEAGYFSFQNPEILGGAFVLTGYAEPILSHGKRHIISLKTGAGLSYHTKIYDATDNPANQFFCTKISFPLYLSARFKYRLSARTYITLSGNYNHISNGGMKQPNYGMNFPTVSLGLESYKDPIPELGRNYTTDLSTKKKGFYFIFEVLSAYKVVDATILYPEKATLSIGFHARAAWQLNRFYSLNAGGEIIMDAAIKETIKRENLGVDYKRFALTAGQDFLFGKVVFTQYLGFYVYSPYRARNVVYQKYELGYRIHKNLLLGVYLKAHTSDAELMGLFLSFVINKK